MRIFDDGIVPVDFDKGTLLRNLEQSEVNARADCLPVTMAPAAMIALFVAAMALKYWIYLPGVRS